MTTNSVTATTNTTTATTSQATTKTGLNKDDFLKLLVTQLQNQDAMNPMEDTQFISQMAQFTSLEQAQNSSKTLDSILTQITNLSTANSYNNGLVMLGKEITYQTAEGLTKTGTVSAVKQNNGVFSVVANNEEVSLLNITLIK